MLGIFSFKQGDAIKVAKPPFALAMADPYRPLLDSHTLVLILPLLPRANKSTQTLRLLQAESNKLFASRSTLLVQNAAIVDLANSLQSTQDAVARSLTKERNPKNSAQQSTKAPATL
ncbi:hypothetical protein BC937DRAFT_91889 [Endogone sp. FLAS-F59071]|nr:hypothetical protein BC937DRAFT_91889 [Endogone sp. FLAS-F59071]|eukprot:RUS21682.1 hypothetical protein BC937DRAFT_91889 [Endogone sp. FLAS-F59071]